jgi:hypothetical protein
MAHILRFPSPQMTSYTLESKQWASQSIYSTWISMANLLLGISSTWVVLVVSDTLGCLILMMPTQSFLSPPLALLIKYASNFLMPPSLSHLTGFISISMFAVSSRISFQYLEEDPRTNRIDDSLQLFTQICSNALLKNVHLVLFLSTLLIRLG